ncbi:M20/M25/M40 family metallo-hydrolase [Plantactinospora sp. KBS50]|uniref:M20/M25/M40 family metallo-hydrolase n=1 Tax=Plantactinospora sp. KBS50 TaxID=2024580 RepID=UPI000BAAE592|nr:M20/M25/M40 family metallo-hydrolase [Plantactinospora sp. KBS50]ASW54289.1 hypothetical protein CIK06_08935 [Plantactinospora sp. KBS50]
MTTHPDTTPETADPEPGNTPAAGDPTAGDPTAGDPTAGDPTAGGPPPGAIPERTDPVPAGDVAAPAPRRQRVAAFAVLLLVLLSGLAATVSLRPPSARPATAPQTEFSAERAVSLLGGIATVPHPAGSAAAGDVREFLLDQLRGLGLQPEVQQRVATRAPDGGRPNVGTVSNIHARIAGTQPTGRVLLVAHYDSVPTGPGASDDGANVAAVLEVARAILAGPRPRNDVDVLFTDAEEAGLLGAQGFVDSGAAGDPARVVVINLEARGVSGPAAMFQMAGTGLAPAVRAADAVTTSFAAAVYDVLPNDTDLSAFRGGGMRGLNFAFFDGAAHYHTPHDDIAHVSRASVQHIGNSALAAARYLGGADLAVQGPDATYFSLFGTVLTYPTWLVLPLAGLALVGYVLLLWAGRRRGLRPRGVGRAAAIFGLTIPAVGLIGIGGWWILTLIRPEFGLGFGAVYRPGPYAVAETLLLLAALVVGLRWVRRRASAQEVVAGLLGWFVALAVLTAVLLPGGAYLFTWPALVGVAALAAALRYTDPGSPWRAVAGCAAAVPGAALVLPIALLLLPALSLALSPVPLLLAALLVAAVAPALEPLPRPRTLTAGTLALVVVAAATAAVGAARDGYDATRPRPVSLGYLLEADTGTATWVSLGGTEQPQVGPLLTGDPVRLDDRAPALGGGTMSSGPAPVAAGLAGPRVEATAADQQGDVRTVRFRLVLPAGTYLADVYADTSAHGILDADVDGVPIDGGQNIAGTTSAAWHWGFRYVAPPAEGVEVTVRTTGPGPVPFRVVTTAPGLPADAGAPALDPKVSWNLWPLMPAQTFVVRTFPL